VTDNTEFTEENQVQEEAAAPSLGLAELGTLLQIVDLATQRGAFRGNELTQVGAIYDKLNTFLSYIQQQQEANAEEGAEEAPADAEADSGEE
jgi:hypothetical protein